jgi:hypothetical protein
MIKAWHLLICLAPLVIAAGALWAAFAAGRRRRVPR